LTIVIGPALLAWVGADNTQALLGVLLLLVLGLALTALIPHLPSAHDSRSTHIGWRGLWQGLNAHRVVVLAGFVGGFFDLGLDSTLPLYGLTLGLNDDASALLVAVSGAGGTLMALPAGLLADRFANPAQGRRAMMTALAGLILLATLVCPLITQHTALVWPIVAIWGTAGSTLYTLVMVDIAATEKGLSLVNSTSVLVLAYTLGGLMASSLTGVLLDWSPKLGFPLLLVGVATIGLLVLRKTREGVQSAA
jgi:MFS family permease